MQFFGVLGVFWTRIPGTNYELKIAWIYFFVVVCMAWPLTAKLIFYHSFRVKFDEWYRELLKGNDPNYPMPPTIEKWDVPIPDGPMAEFVFIYKTHKGSWKTWPEIVKAVKMDENVNILRLVVPTIDTVRYIHLIKLHVQFKKPFLIVGPTGTGKSFYLQVRNYYV